MKKFNAKASLLVSAAAVAGLAIGATVAMAAHQPIQLFTYEEVAAQMQGTVNPANPFSTPRAPQPVLINRVTNQGMPYSPKQTCTGAGMLGNCHSTGNSAGLKSYDDMANKSFHSSLGYNEWMDNSDTGLFMEGNKQTGLNPQKPWLQSHGHNGKW